MLSNAARRSSRPTRALSRGLEVHPHGDGQELELWIDRATCAPATRWSFPADDELRVGVGSFDPRTTSRSRPSSSRSDLGLPAERYQGNWIPHKLRAAVEDGVFFVGDSAGHCLPLTAEGIRTALYFGLACGRELRAVVEGRQHARAGAAALRRVLRRAHAQVRLAAARAAGRRADHAEPLADRRRALLREP